MRRLALSCVGLALVPVWTQAASVRADYMQVDLSKAIEIVTYKDRRIERRDVTLMRQDDGAWRYEKKTRHMTDDMDSIYVVNAAARVKTGSPGWWMLDDGRWGAFTRTDGATLRQDLRIALFGMKLGE